MSYKIKYIPKNGFVPLIDKKNMYLKNIQFGVLYLNKSSYSEKNLNLETVLVILKGKCSVRLKEFKLDSIGEREDVFGGKAYAVYVPPNSDFTVETNEKVEIAVCKAPSKLKGEPKLITPSEVKLNIVGKDNWQRNVYDIVRDNVNAEKLVVGETINPSGNWSSYPPHKHDENSEKEVKMEEIYFFKIKPEKGFGFQRLYNTDRSLDETYTIENNDLVIIPKGYHPVVAAPGYKLYYLWVLAGETRTLKPNDDPDHTWIKN
ncbi:MAG: 5-deoxy-glucuronate isomerase [Candidatus Hodarchaeota archaeon]